MTADLHARLVAALDEEQARAEAARPGPWGVSVEEVHDLHWGDFEAAVLTGPDVYALKARDAEHIAAQDPARTLARVAADRRVLDRHIVRHALDGDECWRCGFGWAWPCPDIRDLAARYGIEVQQ
jgi:hypothetical protein